MIPLTDRRNASAYDAQQLSVRGLGGRWGMPNIQKAVEGLQNGADVLFLLVGAVLVFAMHGGFAFLEAGTVRHKNQVNALCKILVDFAISTVAYFFIGYAIAYGVAFFVSAERSTAAAKRFDPQGLTLVKFFFLAHLRARQCRPSSRAASPSARNSAAQCAATALIVGLFYPLLRGHRLEQELRPAGDFFKGHAGRGVPRLRRLHRRARGGRLDRLLRRAPARAAARALRQGPRHRHPALVDPVARHGLLAAVHRLVRLQRDERPVAARASPA